MPDYPHKPPQLSALAAPAKAKAVKLRVMYRNEWIDVTTSDERFMRKSDRNFTRPVLLIDLSPASVEALLVRASQASIGGKNTVSRLAAHTVFASIGLTQPAKRRRTKS